MSWITPRTWVSGETVTAAIMNAHVRDQLNLLKTDIKNDGTLTAQLKGVGFSSGVQSVGAAETDATGFEFTLPADYLDVGGDALYIDAVIAIAANANTKTLKFYIGAQSKIIRSAADNVAGLQWHCTFKLSRRTSSTAAINGRVLRAVANADGTVQYLNRGFTSLDFTINQAIKFTLQGVTTGDLLIAELNVIHTWRGNSGLV